MEVKFMRQEGWEGMGMGVVRVRSKKEDRGGTRPGQDSVVKKEDRVVPESTYAKTKDEE